MRTKKQFNVGEQSRRFLVALDTYNLFKNDLYDALTETYGEEQGNKFFNEHGEQLETVERIVMDYLRVSFTMQMGTDAETVEI